MRELVRILGATEASTALRVCERFHSRAPSPDYLASALSNSTNLLLVAGEDADLRGFLLGHWLARTVRQETQLFIYELEVAPQYRRRGVATALFNRALQLARERDAKSFVLTNHANAAAKALYRKLGGIAKSGDDLLFVFS